MRKKDGSGNSKGKIKVIGIGPGGLDHLTSKAKEELKAADWVVGYTKYVELIINLVEGKNIYMNGMTHEVERCQRALSLAAQGSRVAVISSGDSGIYGMAGLILQLATADKLFEAIDIEVVPGVPAFVAAGALLGAPLMHDFASISLSDLLTAWEVIEKRLTAAAEADFVIALYNPKSTKRVSGLLSAIDIISRHRQPDVPVGIVRNATREGERISVTSLSKLKNEIDSIDMLTIVIVGNSSSVSDGSSIVTPRGYKLV